MAPSIRCRKQGKQLSLKLERRSSRVCAGANGQSRTHCAGATGADPHSAQARPFAPVHYLISPSATIAVVESEISAGPLIAPARGPAPRVRTAVLRLSSWRRGAMCRTLTTGASGPFTVSPRGPPHLRAVTRRTRPRRSQPPGPQAEEAGSWRDSGARASRGD